MSSIAWRKMLNKKFIFNLVTILLISLMAYRYLSSRLATTITTSQIRSNPFVALKSLSATTTTTAANNWSSAANMSSDHYATVSYVTTPNEDVARQLSRKLVEHRLAACVNIVKNIESIYEWKDKIEQDSEVLMIIKSNSQKSADLAKFVQDNHPYDCPEVVTVRVDSGSKPYLEWIHETINKEPLCAQK